MKQIPTEIALVVLLVGCLLAIGLGLWLGLTWLICLVVGGFGWEIPFWPTFGAVFLVSLLCGWLRPRSK